MSSNKVLIVDDEENILISLSSILEDEGYSVKTCPDAESALKTLEKEEFDVAFIDIWLPKMDGLKLFEIMKEQKREEEVIFISGHGTIEQAVRATKIGAFDFLEKPLSLERVVVAAKNASKKKELLEKEKFFKSELKSDVEIVGESPAMLQLKEQINLVAPSDGRVLIYGENGTGKELVARSIHQLSPRASEPFIEVNCAAIPNELIESELFGHRKGSFTGAIENKKGKFLLANKGTLFLDEVGDMSLMTQAKVLRALEEQKIEPVGASESIKVDVRVIAATNKDLEKEIAEGRFREDLYYRLNVVFIKLPPLRERNSDIPLLFNYYLDYYSKKYKKEKKKLSSSAVKALYECPWNGNVRELKNLAERVIIMHRGEEILEEDLFLKPSSLQRSSDKMYSGSLKEAREAFERDYILKVINDNGGNLAKSAEILGIERRHLYRKLSALKIR
ncbi:MAG: sigma-54-dependent transcriptional regulator [Acidobacteriota bacterium]|nr:sigma-54-dependent Fis family transcriptional regulator [Thermoanaerobaculaceae bacterium]